MYVKLSFFLDLLFVCLFTYSVITNAFPIFATVEKRVFCKLQAVTLHTESTSRHSTQHTEEMLALDPNL